MPRHISIENSHLGTAVELRDITVRQWQAIQRAKLDDNEVGIVLLADMLYIDGEPAGMDRILDMAMHDVMPLLDKVTSMMSFSGEPKND